MPAPLRRRITDRADRLRAFLERRALDQWYDIEHSPLPPRQPGRRFTGRRVAVVGMFGFRCGLQRGAELMVLDYRARGIEVLAVDVTALLTLAPNITTDATPDLDRLVAWRPTDLVVHLNPPLFARVLAAFSPALLAGVAVVGYWAWELTVIPRLWQVCAVFADEIWTPSSFVAEALTSGLGDFQGPIQVVPHAIDRDPMRPVPPARRAELRARAGLEPDAFVAGCSFSFDSNYARKNPCATIDAFRLAFRDGEAARLLIRCGDTANHRRLFEHLLTYAGDDTRICVIDTADLPIPIRDFYGMLDVYVSLHRSEGYGLNMAEAAQSGLPILATGWGLASDIAARPDVHKVAFRLVLPIDPQGVYDDDPHARWAEPDVPHAASLLRQTYASSAAGRDRGQPTSGGSERDMADEGWRRTERRTGE